MPSAVELIRVVLDDVKPDNITVVGPHARALLSDWPDTHNTVKISEYASPAQVMAQAAFTTDWVLAASCLESLDEDSGAQFIGRLRNLISTRFCLVVQAGHDVWNARQLTAFGMERLSPEPLKLGFERGSGVELESAEPVDVFGYDLATYKKTPDWLNADFWANPDRFNKDFW